MKMSKMFNVPAGTVIINEGEVNMDMYKIIYGSCELYTGYQTENETLLGIISGGRFIGEMGLLIQKPAPYTVVTYKDVVLLRITQPDIDDYIANNHHDAYELMRQLAETTYQLKYSMDLFVDDVVKGKVNLDKAKEYKGNMAKQFAKYSAGQKIIAQPQKSTIDINT